MKLDYVIEKLERAGLGTPGKSLFIYAMPAEARSGILVKLPLVGVHIDHDLPGFLRCQVQTIVRNTSVLEGERLADQVIAALTLKERTTWSQPGGVTMTFNYFRPITLPIVYPRSDGNGLEFSINFEVCYVMR